jgi:excisionase family DNA binding protein
MPGDTQGHDPSVGANAVGPVLTVGEVAEALRVSPMTVYRLVNTHELAALRIGKNIRIRVADLDRFLASGAVATDKSEG